MKKKIIISATILVIIAGVVLVLSLFSPNKNDIPKYEKKAIDKGNIEALVITTGSLNPVTTVDVGSQVSGKIDELYVDFNSRVKKDQVIAELDQSQFLTRVKQNEANYQSAKASLKKTKVTLDNTKKKYDRAMNLFEKDLISFEEKEAIETQYYSAMADIQSSEARLEQAESQLDSSKVDLTYTIIKSPIDGVVINRRVNIGQTVAASFQAPVLFQIANDLSKMQVECSVDEADIGKVKEGQKVRFTVDAFPDENFTGKVSQVRYAPEIVQNVVTYTTIVEVDNPEMKLRPGMTATASVVTGEAKNVLRVSNSALRFNPSLSPEEMRELMESMRQEMRERRGGSIRPEGTSPGGDAHRQAAQRPGSGQHASGMRGFSMQGARMRQFARVWMEDESGKLKMVFVRTGVTDNSYTEIVSGSLKEGQLVITGETSGQEDRRTSTSRMFRMF
ncbi:MAG: efflux RND transporter periplasmic adaptor subunit [Candidatus Aminicenantes bacterium]|nr:MAG: efflux RND transporter periplasmic adaptor subunit [Candidatus Aminicenantes bacterium]